MTGYTPIGRYFEVEGGRLYGHVREGRGPALVFLHYWGGSHRTWRPVIEHLNAGQAFVSTDHRGWGRSTAVPGPYGIEQLADDAQSVIDALGCSEYVVVGHSMGGKTAQVLASRQPSGLRGVVLVAPAPPAPVGITAHFQDVLWHCGCRLSIRRGQRPAGRLSLRAGVGTVRSRPVRRIAWPVGVMMVRCCDWPTLR